MGKQEPQIVVFTPAMRTLIADAIESLILSLDEIDGDAEAEDDDPAEEKGDAEPSLGDPFVGRRDADSGRSGADSSARRSWDDRIQRFAMQSATQTRTDFRRDRRSRQLDRS
jgi:hypothetical protein